MTKVSNRKRVAIAKTFVASKLSKQSELKNTPSNDKKLEGWIVEIFSELVWKGA